MVGVGRDLCGSSSPTPLLKQGHLQQAAQDRVQVGLEYLQRRETPQALWAACSRAPSPSEGRSSSSCSDGTSYASVCAEPHAVADSSCRPAARGKYPRWSREKREEEGAAEGRRWRSLEWRGEGDPGKKGRRREWACIFLSLFLTILPYF